MLFRAMSNALLDEEKRRKEQLQKLRADKGGFWSKIFEPGRERNSGLTASDDENVGIHAHLEWRIMPRPGARREATGSVDGF